MIDKTTPQYFHFLFLSFSTRARPRTRSPSGHFHLPAEECSRSAIAKEIVRRFVLKFTRTPACAQAGETAWRIPVGRECFMSQQVELRSKQRARTMGTWQPLPVFFFSFAGNKI